MCSISNSRVGTKPFSWSINPFFPPCSRGWHWWCCLNPMMSSWISWSENTKIIFLDGSFMILTMVEFINQIWLPTKLNNLLISLKSFCWESIIHYIISNQTWSNGKIDFDMILVSIGAETTYRLGELGFKIGFKIIWMNHQELSMKCTKINCPKIDFVQFRAPKKILDRLACHWVE